MHSSPLTFNLEPLTSIFHFRAWPLACCPLRSLHYFRLARHLTTKNSLCSVSRRNFPIRMDTAPDTLFFIAVIFES